MLKASKQREMIEKDLSVRYPMGERKVRCDKISFEIRKIVEQYWEAHTRVSSCTKDKARLRLSRKVHEEHQVHWLEEIEVLLHSFSLECLVICYFSLVPTHAIRLCR
jgi:hypothetical protein